MQESRCIFDSATPNLPIMLRVYVTLIVLATVFSMAWYKIVIQRFLVVYHGLYNNLMNARAGIDRSAMLYCASKLMEISRVL